MTNNRLVSANAQWLRLLKSLRDNGLWTMVKKQKTKELLSYTSIIDMRAPVVTYKERKLGYRFMAAEASWILLGKNMVAAIAPFSKDIEKYSDDGVFFNGAYGPRVVDQLTYIIDSLCDKNSRQAVMTIWRPNPRPSKDIPCTISIQWVIRGDYIHCFSNMRSSDAWLGWPYDIFNFSSLSLYIALLYNRRTKNNVKLGHLYLNVASQHIYEKDYEKASKILNKAAITPDKKWDKPCNIILNTDLFSSPFHLLQWLLEKSRTKGVYKHAKTK